MSREHEVHLVVDKPFAPDELRVLVLTGFNAKPVTALPKRTCHYIYTKHCHSALEAKRSFELAVVIAERTPENPALVEWEIVRGRHRLSPSSTCFSPCSLAGDTHALSLKDLGCTEVRGRRKSADIHVKLLHRAVTDEVLGELLATLRDLGLMVIQTLQPSDGLPYTVFGSQYHGPHWSQWLRAASSVLSQFVANDLAIEATLKTESIVAFHLSPSHQAIPLAFPMFTSDALR